MANVAAASAKPLTGKQLDALLTAHRLGYYDVPRQATLDDVAHVFGISKAAVHNRLQAAEAYVIGDFCRIARDTRTTAETLEQRARAEVERRTRERLGLPTEVEADG